MPLASCCVFVIEEHWAFQVSQTLQGFMHFCHCPSRTGMVSFPLPTPPSLQGYSHQRTLPAASFQLAILPGSHNSSGHTIIYESFASGYTEPRAPQWILGEAEPGSDSIPRRTLIPNSCFAEEATKQEDFHRPKRANEIKLRIHFYPGVKWHIKGLWISFTMKMNFHLHRS